MPVSPPGQEEVWLSRMRVMQEEADVLVRQFYRYECDELAGMAKVARATLTEMIIALEVQQAEKGVPTS